MSNPYLRKLFKNTRSSWTVKLAFPGILLGLLFLLAAIQSNSILNQILGSEQTGDYITINRKVSLLNSIGMSGKFSDEEIKEIEELDQVEELGQFLSNGFEVMGSSSTLGFSTLLFFEAIEDQFLEESLAPFEWEVGEKEVPIIISKDFLALYNFGFAPSQGLPQFNQGTISKFTFTLSLSGKGRKQQFRGRIVGFSERINSVLIPIEFMNWANERFGGTYSEGSSRLILKVDNPQSKEFKSYLKKKGFERNRSNKASDAIRTALNGLTYFLGFLGFSLFGLSLLILMLSYQLIVAKSALSIRRLLEIGYSPKQISQVLSRQFIIVFGAIVLLTLLILQVGNTFFAKFLASEDFNISPLLSPTTIVAGFIMFLLVFIFPRFIQKKIISIGR